MDWKVLALQLYNNLSPKVQSMFWSLDGDSKHVAGFPANISHMADLDKVDDVIKKQHGQLNIRFANADALNFAPLDTMTEAHYNNLININVKEALLTVQKALPTFADGGSIILSGSVASYKAGASGSVVSATKGAVRSFARCWTVDLKEHKIRVHVVSPGPIVTPMLRDHGQEEEKTKAFVDKIAASTVMNRLETSEELAEAVAFLGSSDSSYITGIELFVDGSVAQIKDSLMLWIHIDNERSPYCSTQISIEEKIEISTLHRRFLSNYSSLFKLMVWARGGLDQNQRAPEAFFHICWTSRATSTSLDYRLVSGNIHTDFPSSLLNVRFYL